MLPSTRQLCDHLRPTTLRDLFQPLAMVQRLEQMVRDKRLMNMLFYGQPGIGKTSAARILLKEIDAEVLDINGSSSTGIDTVRDEIASFCGSASLWGQLKVVFIDECEYLSKNAQAAMRGTVEKYPWAAFLLTANDVSKLHPAIKSRFLEVCFDVSVLDANAVIERVLPMYEQRLLELGCKVPYERLRQIMYLKFPDLRAVAMKLEFEGGFNPTKIVPNGTNSDDSNVAA
jgi:replication-associated recombination protein RarA